MFFLVLHEPRGAQQDRPTGGSVEVVGPQLRMDLTSGQGRRYHQLHIYIIMLPKLFCSVCGLFYLLFFSEREACDQDQGS
jgi:hypothetical protein